MSQNTILACPICNETSLSKTIDVPDWLLTKESFTLSKCNNCSFVFTAKPPTESEAYKYYETEEYIEHSDNREGIINKLYHFGRDLMLKYKSRIIGALPINGKAILDIGSASGYYLNHMKNLGYEVSGVEISEKARDLCKKQFNIDAITPDQFLSDSNNSKYDVISLWHVLEHVYPLNEYMIKMKSLLNKNGRLLIAVPNLKSFDANYYKEFWCAYDTPRHLWHFSPDSLKNLAQKHGFKVEKLKKLPLDPFYNSMVSSTYKAKWAFLPFAVCVGFVSYLNSIFNIQKSSSVIYILTSEK